MSSSLFSGGFKNGILQCLSLIKSREWPFNPVRSVASWSEILLSADYKIVIPGPDGPNLKLIEKLKEHNFTLATDPNGYGWKNEINKLIKNLVFCK